MRILDYVAVGACVLAVIALPVFFYELARRPVRAAFFLVVPVFVFFCALDLSRRIAQAAVLDALDAMSDSAQVLVNGAPETSRQEVIGAISS